VTQPNPEDAKAAAEKAAAAKKSTVKVLDVVEFTRHDPITGHDHTDVGVVVDVDADGGPLVVRPLAAYHHTDVDPANVQVLTANDVS
jgi:hypothetical protein